jgi:hypothetical protein
MTESSRLEKLEQFHEFFAIQHEFSVNVRLVTGELPNYDQFIKSIPLPFKIATEVATIDHSALRPIQGLNQVAGHLVEFLNYQSQKIDMLISYILSQQDDENTRFAGVAFGGGGITFNAAEPFQCGDFIELKVFILDAHCALFCLAEIIEVNSVSSHYQHKAIFHYIRNEDREALVRTSLHEQSKQLQALAKQRNQAKSR